MSVLYHPNKAIVVVDTVSRITMGSVCHIDESKKDLVMDVHRLSRMGVILEDSPNGGFMVHHYSQSSLLVEVKSKQYLDKSLMELKESVLRRINEEIPLGWMVF